MLKGCDISKWQGIVDFNSLKSSIDFIVIRSSYGVGYVDGQFQRNRDEARKIGLVRGFYHFAYPDLNEPEAEADWFCKVVGTPQKGEFLVLDFERDATNPADWVKRFMLRVSGQMGGYKPLLYMDKSRMKKDWSSVIQNGNGLWLAYWDFDPNSTNYGDGVPWGTIAMRQYSNNETFPGIEGRVDANVFYGDKAQLLRYGYQGQEISPQPVPQPYDTFKEDEVIDILYQVLTGEHASQDEIVWRKASGMTPVEIGNDIANGDSRFDIRWGAEEKPTDPTIPEIPPNHCPVPEEPKEVTDEECLTRVKSIASTKKGFWNKLSFVLSLME
jgi:GH25 family lysozyme M1 (1,4-beta-N-acetylmuramidase)